MVPNLQLVHPKSSKSKSSIVSPGPETSAEVIEVEECEGDQMQTSSQSDGNLEEGSQLLSALSTAKTRAEIAALSTLIPNEETTIPSSFPSSCTGIAEVVGSNPAQSLKIFSGLCSSSVTAALALMTVNFNTS